jgi:hypothetical protein
MLLVQDQLSSEPVTLTSPCQPSRLPDLPDNFGTAATLEAQAAQLTAWHQGAVADYAACAAHQAELSAWVRERVKK